MADSNPRGDQPTVPARQIAPRDPSLSYRITGIKAASTRKPTRQATRG